MKKVVVIFVVGVFLSLGCSSGALSAARSGGHAGGGHFSSGSHFGGGWHGGGWHGSVRFGFGPWWGYPYGYPYYYPYYGYPYSYPSYVYPYSAYPPLDNQLPVPSEPQQSYWYYCQDPQGYYPYVGNCPGGWQQVVPTPPPSGKEGVAP